ncbi:MAG: Asp23/Gls24 family envelope stress response protein [Candidatus Bipolaricaulia bacterium]
MKQRNELEEEQEGHIVSGEGRINISEEVVAAIAGLAASEVEGLGAMRGNVADGLSAIFGGESLKRGVTTEVDAGNVRITLKVAVKYGYPVHEVARKIQQNVKQEVEDMTGLQVSAVDIYVQKLQLPEEETVLDEEEPEPEEEIEEWTEG